MKILGEVVGELYRKFQNFIYPPLPVCPVCGREFENYYANLFICQACLKRIPLIVPPVCLSCGRPVRGEGNDSPCPECRRESRYYSRALAVALYKDFMKELLHSVKFDFRPDLARAVGSLMAVRAENEPGFDEVSAVIPVPLHNGKLRERGYNQARVMAEYVAGTLRRPLLADVLVRIRPTESQSRLGREERQKNVAGAFAVTDCRSVAGKNLLLIDDICTTGYTFSECARVLLLAGALKIQVYAAAVGVLEDTWLRR